MTSTAFPVRAKIGEEVIGEVEGVVSPFGKSAAGKLAGQVAPGWPEYVL